jgi:hypothetical protein
VIEGLTFFCAVPWFLVRLREFCGSDSNQCFRFSNDFSAFLACFNLQRFIHGNEGFLNSSSFHNVEGSERTMESWKVDLRNTKNYTLLGDVGEAITLHYLSSHGFFIVTRPIKFLHGGLFLVSAHYQIKPPKMNRSHWLNDEQKEYLEKFPSWDYVAFKREGMRKSSPYVVEVKTVKGETKPHKKPKSNSIFEAKALGFKPMLVVIKLFDNWNILVETNEI